MTHKNLVCYTPLCPVEAVKIVYEDALVGKELLAVVRCPACTKPMTEIKPMPGDLPQED